MIRQYVASTINTLRHWIKSNVEYFGQTVIDHPAKLILGEERADEKDQVRQFIKTLEDNLEAYKKRMKEESPHMDAADRRGVTQIIRRTERVIEKAKSMLANM